MRVIIALLKTKIKVYTQKHGGDLVQRVETTLRNIGGKPIFLKKTGFHALYENSANTLGKYFQVQTYDASSI